MRKLHYIGINKDGNKVDVTTLTEKENFKAQGYVFTDKLIEETKEETEEERIKRFARIDKRDAKRKERKKAADALN